MWGNETELFYYRHISEVPYDKYEGFMPIRKEGWGVVRYLVGGTAMNDDVAGLAKTYLVFDSSTDEVVSYFSLRAGFVSSNERLMGRGFDTVPGIEISNFAHNKAYFDKYKEVKGIGKYIFDNIIVKIIQKASEDVGIALIYIFALPEKTLVERYKKYGFSRLDKTQESILHRRIRPRYDKGCIFMYQKL